MSMAYLRRQLEAIELQNTGKWSDKMCDEGYDLTRLTDGELHAQIKKIERTLRVTGLIISDGGRKLRRFLLKHLLEETRREDHDKVSKFLANFICYIYVSQCKCTGFNRTWLLAIL